MDRRTSFELAQYALEQAEARKAASWKKYISTPPPSSASRFPSDAEVMAQAQRANPFEKGRNFNLTAQMRLMKIAPGVAESLRLLAEERG